MASLTLGIGGSVGGAVLASAAAGAEFGTIIPGFGTLIGAAIGGAIGGLAGSFIDKNLLFPAIIGKQSTFRGQMLADMPLTTASLGSPINFCMGRQSRIPGTIIWVSPLKTVPTTQHLGGKGGGNVVTNNYYVSLAVALCEGPISGIRKIWADGILIYDQNSNLQGGVDNRYDAINIYDGTQGNSTGAVLYSGTATDGDSNSITLDAGASSSDTAYDGCLIQITAGTGSLAGPSGGISTGGAGETATVAGFDTTTKVCNITGSWAVVPTSASHYVIISPAGTTLDSGTAQGGDSYSIILSPASTGYPSYVGSTIHITSGPGSAGPLLTGESAHIIQYNGSTKVAKIRGTWPVIPDATSQYNIMLPGADPVMQAIQGSKTVPMYVNTAFFVISNLNTSPWGQRIPNFTALVEAQDQLMLADAISDIWQRGGRDTSEIDVTWLAGDEVVGYTISGPQTPTAMMEPLLTAYDVVLQERDGITEFRKRINAVPVVLDPTKFAAYEDGGPEPARSIQVDDPPDFTLPKYVYVQHQDPAMFWQTGAQRATKQTAPVGVVKTVNLPIAMTANNARTIAKRILWSNWAERWSLSMTLMPSQIHLQESDLFTANVDSYNYQGRAASVTQGANYILEVKGQSEQQSLLTQSAIADIPGIGAEPAPVGQVTHTLVLIECGIMPGDNYKQGVHFGVSRSDPGDSWGGGAIYTSGNALINYARWFYYLEETTIGTVQAGVLPNNPDLNTWDYSTTITVQILNQNPPTSTTEEDVLENWSNHAYIGTNGGGGEVIAFQTVTQIDDQTYQLSGILRGRLGTDTRTNGHALLEYFALLGPTNGMHWVNTGNVGVTVYHKAHPAGNTPLKDITPVSSLRLNAAQTPWAPAAISGTRDGSNNLTVVYSRRSNTPCIIFQSPFAEVPQNFPTLAFDFVIYTDNTFTTIRNTYRVAGNEAIGVQNSWIYTAAKQTADGITPGNPVYAIIYQINLNLGYNANRGYGAQVTL